MSILSEFVHNYAPQNGWGTFFTAAFGAFAGAFAASRAHSKRTIIAELNALNSAHELSVSIANRFMAFKRQHVLPLKQDFERIKTEYANHRTMMQTAGAQNQTFHFTAELRSLSPLAMPNLALEKIIFEKTLIRGRGLAALVELVGSIDALGISMRARNEMVEESRNNTRSDRQRLEFFLGLRTSTGVIDERFPSNIIAISMQVDDCIFFAKTLSSDVARYANYLRGKERWMYWLRVPKIAATDWSFAEKIGMLPDESEYERWLRGFPSPKPRWQRVVSALRLRKK